MSDTAKTLAPEEVLGEKKITCSTAGALQVSVKDGKLLRVEPLEYSAEEAGETWKLEVNGKTYRPPYTHGLLPWGMVGKQMAYSPNRVMYPMKRVDWDPNGERNTQNRGISGYERISWDEAFDIIESELRKTWDELGPSGIGDFYSAHPEWGSLHYFFSEWQRFFDMIDATHIDFTPNSWEGWAAGATQMWGFWAANGIPSAPGTLQDITEHDDIILLWGDDPLFHNVYNGVDEAHIWRWWRELGKEIVVIDPYFNETAAAYADKWIPIRPGTDGALACGIAYIWITEDLYEKEYVDTHCIGFDEEHMPEGVPANMSFKSYILGEGEDKTPKTPEWASEKCGVPVRVIEKLAREWGTKPASLWAFVSGTCRREYADTYERMVITLAMMRGMGMPGSHLIASNLTLAGPYDGETQIGPTGYADGGMNAVLGYYSLNQTPQHMTFQKLLDMTLADGYDYYGGDLFNMSADEYYHVRHYPEEGCNKIRMLWQRGSSFTNPPHRVRHLEFIRHPSIETYIVNAPWFDRDCRMADLVLPTTTMYERSDLTEPAKVGQYVEACCIGLRSAIYHQQCIEKVGESKTDMEILDEIAHRIGRDGEYLMGETEDTLIGKLYAKTNIPLTYEEMKEKGCYIWPAPKNYEDYQSKKQFNAFYRDPEGNPMETPSGKVEIFSQLIWEHYGNNPEIPPVPHYIPEKEGWENTELKKKYPLQHLMAHPKFRFHGKYNDCTWLTDEYKVVGPDGYKYEPVLMHPKDAADRGLVEGDIVVAYNDRGKIMAGVHVTERVAQGVAQLTYGSWNDPIDGGYGAPDRGGDGNVLGNGGPMSPHHLGGAYNSNLIEIEKADLEALAAEYPEGWAGKYRSWNREA